ncbi:MAG: hypothetical protein A2Y38_26760 [Spirochaetes bacterium GWB1_59_5]|nr:MAG: hypothetical protein A2Y38_26760 [Spirochaetes bacterium GWB1_59_5]
MTETVTAAPEAVAKSQWILDLIPAESPLGRIFTIDTALKLTRVGISIVLGLLFVGLIMTVLKRITRKRLNARSGSLVVKLAQYLGFALIAINTLEAAEIDLSALLGAAGIAGVALGFAAQTSVSNFISGFFLMSEKTFTVGDVVTVDTTTGVVYSIDALSVKLRTFDNQLVRIPNETLIKTNVTNVTRFETRRLNVKITITHATDIEKARVLLFEAAEATEIVLRQPEPLFMIQGIGKDGVDLLFGVWLTNDDWVSGNNDIYAGIQKRFRAAGIEFAHATMTVYEKKAREPSVAGRSS